jgi:hypothetical protein
MMKESNPSKRQTGESTESKKAFASFVGVDLHKCSVTLKAVAPDGQVIASLTSDTKCVERIGAWIEALPQPCWMAVEAVSFAEWFIDRYRSCMKSLLLAANIRGPQFDGASAQRWLLAHGHLLKDVQRNAFANFLDIILLIERQREPLRRQIIFANRSEDFAAQTTLLKSVCGIDEIWACIIAAEVGPFQRFPNADAVEFWAGLTPDTKESAGRLQSGNITKAGSATLRWALGKAALSLCQSDARQEAVRQRLIKRIGKPKANVAMARRLLRILYAMFRDGTLYERTEPTNHLRQANAARKNKRQRTQEAA